MVPVTGVALGMGRGIAQAVPCGDRVTIRDPDENAGRTCLAG
jgi:hypothetical protein